MPKVTLTDLTAGYGLQASYNANNDAIEAAFENTLSRDGSTPNAMAAELDMNSNKITNLAQGTSSNDAVTLSQLVGKVFSELDVGAATLVTTIAAMKAIAAPSSGDIVIVTEEGRSGIFVFDTGLTFAANNGTTYKADDATIGSWLLKAGVFNAPFTIPVGAGEQFTTINSALDHLSAIRPAFNFIGGLSTGGFADLTCTIELQAGFTMAEQVHLVNVDFQWVTLTTAEVTGVVPVSRAAMTSNFTARGEWDDYPLFGANRAGMLTFNDIIFELDATGTAAGRHGMVLREGSTFRASYDCGIRNAGEHALYMSYHSSANLMNFDVSGALGVGFYIRHHSKVHCRNVVRAEDLVLYAIIAEHDSVFNSTGGVSFLGDPAFSSTALIRAYSGSTITINATSTYPTKADRLLQANASRVVLAEDSATINLVGGIYVEGGAGTFVVLDADGGEINANDVNLSGTTEARGIRAQNGGVVRAVGASYGTKSTADAVVETDGQIIGETIIGTFTITTVGLAVEASDTARYTVSNGQVVLQIPYLTGTSDDTIFQLTGLPTELRPSVEATNLPILCRDNGVQAFSLLYITVGGVMNLYYGATAAAWTNSGTKRCAGGTVTYLL